MTTHATLNGTITATGGENCTQRGFEWGYSPGSYPNSWTESGSFGTGAFSYYKTGLTNNATVYYRAKAYNSAGWGYGGEQSFPTWNTVAPTDSGVGSEIFSSDRTFADSGTSDEVPTIEATLETVSDGGTPSIEDWLVGDMKTVTDDAIGDDEALPILAEFTATDDGSGLEIVNLDRPFTDEGSGVDALDVSMTLLATDDGLGDDVFEVLMPILYLDDSGIGADFAWRLQGSCLLDDFALPHVLTIRIVDEAVMSDKKIHPPALPKRKLIGKPGRVVEIGGWTKSQSDIEAMRALMDGTSHIFIHPSGDTIKVLIKDFLPDQVADNYGRRGYRIMLMECR